MPPETEVKTAPVPGKDPATGQFVKGNQIGPGRGHKKRPDDSLTLFERMVKILPEEWPERDIRQLARDNPSAYRRLLEIAQKVDQGPGRGGTSETDPAPADESTQELLRLVDDL